MFLKAKGLLRRVANSVLYRKNSFFMCLTVSHVILQCTVFENHKNQSHLKLRYFWRENGTLLDNFQAMSLNRF